MKGVISAVGFVAAICALVIAGYQYGFSSDRLEDQLTAMKQEQSAQLRESQRQIDDLKLQLMTASQKADAAALIANRAEIRAEGIQSQTQALGRELKVDVATPFETTVAEAEKRLEVSIATPATTNATVNATLGAPPIEMTFSDFYFKSQGCQRYEAGFKCKVLVANLRDYLRELRTGASAILYDDQEDSYGARFFEFQDTRGSGSSYGNDMAAKSRSNMYFTFKQVAHNRTPKRILVQAEDGESKSELSQELRTWLIE